MRFIFSLALSVCSLLTASAIRDYNFEIHLVNQDAPKGTCTAVELDDFSNRFLPVLLSVLADPKYNLKATKESDWGKSIPANRKERDLMTCSYCTGPLFGGDPYTCINYWHCIGRRMLRSQRELTEAEVLEIKTVTEGAMRGLVNKFANTSPYSADCTKALMGGTIGSTLAIL